MWIILKVFLVLRTFESSKPKLVQIQLTKKIPGKWKTNFLEFSRYFYQSRFNPGEILWKCDFKQFGAMWKTIKNIVGFGVMASLGKFLKANTCMNFQDLSYFCLWFLRRFWCVKKTKISNVVKKVERLMIGKIIKISSPYRIEI